MFSSSVIEEKRDSNRYTLSVYSHGAMFLNLLNGLFSSLKPTVLGKSSPVYKSYDTETESAYFNAYTTVQSGITLYKKQTKCCTSSMTEVYRVYSKHRGH